MLLSDEEIKAIREALFKDIEYQILDENEAHLYAQRKYNKAQLKKVVEWGEEDCPHTQLPQDTSNKYEPLNLTPLKKHECPECWQSILKEIE